MSVLTANLCFAGMSQLQALQGMSRSSRTGISCTGGQESLLSTLRPNTVAQICRSTLRFSLAVRRRTIHSREPRDGRCVGPNFRVRNDMADPSKNRVCCGHAAGHFVVSQGASQAIGPAGAAMGFSSTCPTPRIFHRWLGVLRERTDLS